MSHTPGPWHVGKRDPEWLPIRDANDLWVCDCGFRNEVSENEANANLIAASPDLLEACKAMVAWDEAENNARPYVEDGGIAFRNRLNLCAEAFDKARAAIKKAEGQS